MKINLPQMILYGETKLKKLQLMQQMSIEERLEK